MPKQSTAQIEQSHQHLFIPGYNQDEKYCKCGALKISYEEFERRRDEWNNYFQLVSQSEAKRDFDEMKIAFKARNIEKMREIKARVNKRCWVNPDYRGLMDEPKFLFKESEYMSKPSFPDPTTWNKYVTE